MDFSLKRSPLPPTFGLHSVVSVLILLSWQRLPHFLRPEWLFAVTSLVKRGSHNLCTKLVTSGCGQAEILRRSLAQSPVLRLAQLQPWAFCWDMRMLEEQCLPASLPLLREGSSTLALGGLERCFQNGQGDWSGFWRVSPWVDAETPTPPSSASGWHIP